MKQLTNFSIRKPIADGFVDDAFEKAHVKTYSRKTKAGSTVQVQEHEDKRQKKQVQAPAKQQSPKNPQQEQQQQQQQQENLPQGKTAALETEMKHLQFMAQRYPHIVDSEKLAARAKVIRDALRTVDETLQTAEFAKHGADAEGKTKKVVNLHEHLAKARQKRAENLAAKKKDFEREFAKNHPDEDAFTKNRHTDEMKDMTSLYKQFREADLSNEDERKYWLLKLDTRRSKTSKDNKEALKLIDEMEKKLGEVKKKAAYDEFWNKQNKKMKKEREEQKKSRSEWDELHQD